MNSLAYASINQLKRALKLKQISPKELFMHCKERALAYNDTLHALLELFEWSDEYAQDDTKPLYGIPGILKDNICVKGQIASCGSRILAHYRAPYDATVTERLKIAGSSFVGRANMDEFAMGSSTETSAFAKACNPWNKELVPGGSSGGSAIAVATGMVPWALGTETGGSVRQPAAFCNIVGYKPTYGLISRYGLVAYGSSLDQAGIFARSVEDVACVLSVVAGKDMHDPSTLPVEKNDYTKQLSHFSIAGVRIGIVENALTAQGMDQEIATAITAATKVYEQLGAIIKPLQLPTLDFGAAAYFIISRAEAASNLARFDGVRYGMRAKDTGSLTELYQKTRHDGFGPEVRKRIMVGNYVLSAGHAAQFYENAKRVIRLMRQELKNTFAHEVDLILMPTSSMPPFKIGAFQADPLQMDLQDYFTCPANLVGIPAISIPAGFTKAGLPIGLQLMAGHLQDELLLCAAQAYEQQTDWSARRPEGF